MTLSKILGTGAIAGALGFSVIGLAGVADAATTPQITPSVSQHAELTGWGGPGWHGPGWGRGPGFGGPGFGGPGFGGPGFGPGFGPGPVGWGAPLPPPPPCAFGLCI